MSSHRLETFLKDKGLNRYKLGKELDISPPTIRIFLNNPSEFKAKHIKKMAYLTDEHFEKILGLILEYRNLAIDENSKITIGKINDIFYKHKD